MGELLGELNEMRSL